MLETNVVFGHIYLYECVNAHIDYNVNGVIRVLSYEINIYIYIYHVIYNSNTPYSYG